MMGYLLQISQANNMIEKFIIGRKKLRGSMFFGISMLNKVWKVIKLISIFRNGKILEHILAV